MTPKSLFNIVLKILGILLVRDLLAALPQLLTYIGWWTSQDRGTDILAGVSMSLLVILVEAFISYNLIFKSDWLIDLFKLDKGFDQETIPLNIHRSTVLAIAIIVLGGLILTDEIPNFFRRLYSYYDDRRMARGLEIKDISIAPMVLSFVKIVVGLILVGNQKDIVDYIEMRRKK